MFQDELAEKLDEINEAFASAMLWFCSHYTEEDLLKFNDHMKGLYVEYDNISKQLRNNFYFNISYN